MGLCLLFNVFSTDAQALFGALEDTVSQVVFTLAGLLFVPFGILGGGYTFVLALQRTKIVKNGFIIPAIVQVQKEEWSDSTSYCVRVMSCNLAEGLCAEPIPIYAPSWLRDFMLMQALTADIFVDARGNVGAFELEQGLVWCC